MGKIGVQGGGWGASAGQAGEKEGLSPAFFGFWVGSGLRTEPVEPRRPS